MYHQLTQLILVQFRQFARYPGALFWAIGFPILMTWGLGVAFTEKAGIVRKVAIITDTPDYQKDTSILKVFLKDNTQSIKESREGISQNEKVVKDEKFGDTRFQFLKTSWDSAVVLLKQGTIAVLIKEEAGGIYYHFDPFNPESRLTYMQLSSIFDKNVVPANTAEIKPMTVKGTRYIDFLVPGLLAMGIMMTNMWGISYTLIDTRIKKLLRRMVATPMKKSYFFISHLVARLALSFVETILLMAFAYFVFDVSVQGSMLALFVIFVAGNILFSGLAVLIASRTANAEIGTGLINAVNTPMTFLSGIFFSYHHFPDWIISIIQCLPLTLLADTVRGIFIEGNGLHQIMIPSLILSGVGIVCLSIGLKIYKWY